MNHPDPRIDAALGGLVSAKLAHIDLSLDRIERLLKALGNPQEKLPPVVHVAGTNGKGSLLAYLTAIFQAAGYRVHRYISPHLVRFNERIVLSDKEIEDDRLLDALERVRRETEHQPVTYFEATTAAAFLAFAEIPADVLLLETGLGGRLDATNMVRAPSLTAITPVSMDHMDYLGDTLTSIAGEKAGIIKPGVPCIVGPQPLEAAKVIAAAALRTGAPLFRFGVEWHAAPEGKGFRYRSATHDAVFPLPALEGAHQLFNAATAVACIDRLSGFKVSEAHIATGLAQARWPARLQRLTEGRLAELLPQGSELWLDGGHNPAAGEAIAAWMRRQQKPVHILCGMLETKDTTEFLRPIAPLAASLTGVTADSRVQSHQSRPPSVIAALAADLGVKVTSAAEGDNFKSIIESLVSNNENDPFTLLICGSLYLAGNILLQNGQTS